MDKGLERFIVLVVPFFIGTIATFCYYFMRIPIFFFFRDEASPFQDKNFFTGWSKPIGKSASATASANYYYVVMISHDSPIKMIHKRKTNGPPPLSTV